MCPHTAIYIHTHTLAHIYICPHATIYDMHVCIYVSYVCVCVCVCVCLCVCVCMYIYIYMFIYIGEMLETFTALYEGTHAALNAGEAAGGYKDGCDAAWAAMLQVGAKKKSYSVYLLNQYKSNSVYLLFTSFTSTKEAAGGCDGARCTILLALLYKTTHT